VAGVLVMISQLTKNERDFALIIPLALSACGLALGIAERADPLGSHGVLVLIAGILGVFGVICGYFDPEPGEDRLRRYYDEPSKVGIILPMAWAVFGLFVGD
jgi:cytochrome c oxidase cbb3-type subunit 1